MTLHIYLVYIAAHITWPCFSCELPMVMSINQLSKLCQWAEPPLVGGREKKTLTSLNHLVTDSQWMRWSNYIDGPMWWMTECHQYQSQYIPTQVQIWRLYGWRVALTRVHVNQSRCALKDAVWTEEEWVNRWLEGWEAFKARKSQNRCAEHLQADTPEFDGLARQLKHKRDINVQTPFFWDWQSFFRVW